MSLVQLKNIYLVLLDYNLYTSVWSLNGEGLARGILWLFMVFWVVTTDSSIPRCLPVVPGADALEVAAAFLLALEVEVLLLLRFSMLLIRDLTSDHLRGEPTMASSSSGDLSL